MEEYLTKTIARKEQCHLCGGKVCASDEMVRRNQRNEVSVEEAREEDGDTYHNEGHLALFIFDLSTTKNTRSRRLTGQRSRH